MGLTESLCYYNTLFINQCSYVGIFLLMALESMVAPIPSELVMPFAGFLIFIGFVHEFIECGTHRHFKRSASFMLTSLV